MSAIDPIFGIAPPEDSSWVPSPGYLLRRNRVIATMVKLPQTLDLLEMGCGAGALIADFRAMGHICTAVESSPDARALAKQFHAADENVTISAELSKDWDERFDCLVSFEVLEHIEHDAVVLREWISLVRPGGYIILSVPAGPQRWDASDEWAGHFRRYTRTGLQELVQECGARVESIETYGFPLANIIAPIRARTKAKAHSSDDVALRTAESGVVRSAEKRMLPLLKTKPGRFALRGFFALQSMAARTDLGPAYLLVARKMGDE